jgi:hypothetical protein
MTQPRDPEAGPPPCMPYPDDREYKTIGVHCPNCESRQGCWLEYLRWERHTGCRYNEDQYHLIDMAPFESVSDDILRIVHAFPDAGRRDEVRLLARAVRSVEIERDALRLEVSQLTKKCEDALALADGFNRQRVTAVRAWPEAIAERDALTAEIGRLKPIAQIAAHAEHDDTFGSVKIYRYDSPQLFDGQPVSAGAIHLRTAARFALGLKDDP